MAKPIPRPTPTEQPFYDACAAGKLVLQRCQHCGHVLFYPRTHCDACQSDQLAWEDASGAGTIASYTVVRRAVSADFEAPYVIALIDLAEAAPVQVVHERADDVVVRRDEHAPPSF